MEETSELLNEGNPIPLLKKAAGAAAQGAGAAEAGKGGKGSFFNLVEKACKSAETAKASIGKDQEGPAPELQPGRGR